MNIMKKTESQQPYFALRTPVSRRTMLKGAGVTLALPLLDVMQPVLVQTKPAAKPRRMLAICNNLGLLADSSFPRTLGANISLRLIWKHCNHTAITSQCSAVFLIPTWMAGIRQMSVFSLPRRIRVAVRFAIQSRSIRSLRNRSAFKPGFLH